MWSVLSSPLKGARILDLEIRNNLSLLFNTRQGSLIHLPDYGLPDINKVYETMPHSIHGFLADLRALIIKYEPRLHRVKLIQMGSALQGSVLSLLLTASIQDNDNYGLQVQFTSHRISLISTYEGQYCA